MEQIVIQDLLLEQIKNNMVDKVIEILKETKDMSTTEKEAYAAQLKQKVSEKKIATVIREQSGITDAEAYNQTGLELYLDIVLVFNYINEIASAISRHIILNRSIINHVYSQISELNDRLDEHLSVMSTPGSPYCFYESFNTETNKENDVNLYRERYNEKIPEECILYGDTEHKCLSMGYARKQNVMVYKNGVVMGSIEITKQYGSGFIKARNPENKLDNAIDISKSSYWSETILANAEFKIKGQGFESGFGQKPLNRSFYDLPRGALCEVCLTFESLTKVNELDLSPFGSFPFDVIAIRYSLTDDEDDIVYDIVSPQNELNEWLTSQTIDKPYVFHFPEIQCKKLYILLNQLHCIRNTYLVSSNQILKNQLWFNSIDENEIQLKSDSSKVFLPVLMDQAEENQIWKYVTNKMAENKNLNINDTILNTKDKMVPVTKYQYTYGFYNIAPNYVEFQKTGVYVTKDISIDGAIKSIKLRTNEEHFLSTDGFIVSDIEYYITDKQNPTYTDWISICPYNKSVVERELLQLDYSVCYLRHKAICETKIGTDENGNQKVETIRPIVYMNDIVLMENTDYILRFDSDLFVTAIEISNIDHFALYTVSYIPVDTEKEITLINEENGLKANNSYEEIMGNGTAAYQLSEYPFYDENNKDTHVKIMNISDGTFISERIGNSIECVTNKTNPEDSFKNFTKSNVLQYYTLGRFLYFNRPIKKEEKIEINYPAFSSKIKLKIIMRRNTKKDSWITPILNDYRLEFTTI